MSCDKWFEHAHHVCQYMVSTDSRCCGQCDPTSCFYLHSRQGRNIMFGAPLGVSESGVLTETLWPSKYNRGSMSGFSDETDTPQSVHQLWAREWLNNWYRRQAGSRPTSPC